MVKDDRKTNRTVSLPPDQKCERRRLRCISLPPEQDDYLDQFDNASRVVQQLLARDMKAKGH